MTAIRGLISKGIKWWVGNKGCVVPWCSGEIEGHYISRNYLLGTACGKHKKILAETLRELFNKKGIEVEFVKKGESREGQKETEIIEAG